MDRGRRNKVRFIQASPEVMQFSPRGKAGRPEEVELRLDHFETIKLADFQGYNQSEGAKQLGLSRASFGRILREGRALLADAIVNGKIIRIRTGKVQVGVKHENLPIKKFRAESIHPRQDMTDRFPSGRAKQDGEVEVSEAEIRHKILRAS